MSTASKRKGPAMKAKAAKKRKRSSVPRSLVPKAGGPIGQTYTTVMSLCEQVTFTPVAVAGGLAHKYFKANGMYDPTYNDVSAHQPHGYDQLAILYHNFVVTASTCEVTFFPKRPLQTIPATTAGTQGSYQVFGNQPMVGFIAQKPEPYTILNQEILESVIEQPGMKIISFNEESNPQRLRTSWSLKKTYAQVKAQGDDTMQGTTATGGGATAGDPANTEYFVIGFGPGNKTASLAPLDAIVRISYKVTWFTPRNIARSD